MCTPYARELYKSLERIIFVLFCTIATEFIYLCIYYTNTILLFFSLSLSRVNNETRICDRIKGFLCDAYNMCLRSCGFVAAILTCYYMPYGGRVT